MFDRATADCMPMEVGDEELPSWRADLLRQGGGAD